MNYPKLSTAIDQYIESILPTKSINYQTSLRSQLRYWNSHLGDYKINKITPQLVQDHLPEGSNGTRNRYLSTLSVVYGEYGTNPCRQIKRGKETWRVRFLSDDERFRLLQECKKSRSKILYPIVVVALSTGARKMEILKLTWEQVDLQKGLIHLVETKNDTPRTIPVTGHALELLSKLPRKSKYVFPTRTGEYRRHLDSCWYPTLRKANIKEFTFHDLRHSCASLLAMQGVPLLDIATILGHKSLEMTRRYSHLSVNHLRGVLGNLNDMMFPDSP